MVINGFSVYFVVQKACKVTNLTYNGIEKNDALRRVNQGEDK